MSDQAERLRERMKAQGLQGSAPRGRALAAEDLSGTGTAVATALAESPEGRDRSIPGSVGSSDALPIWGGAGVDLPLILSGLAQALDRRGIPIVPVPSVSQAAARVFVSRADPAAVMAAYRAMAASAPAPGGDTDAALDAAGDRWRGLWLVAVQGYPGGNRIGQAVKVTAHTYRGLRVTYLGTLPAIRRGRLPEEAGLALSTAALRVQAVWGGDGT